MKTVKKGRKQKGWAKKVKCTGSGNGGGGCGAILLVEQGDLYKTFRHCYGDSYPDVFITFACQECGVETDIEAPSSVTENLTSKSEFNKKSKT